MNDHTTPPTPDDVPAPVPALRRVHGVGRCTVALLALAGVAWAVRAVWEIRLAVTGEPASGPPDQGGGVHRPLTSLENSYHLVGDVGAATALICAIAFLLWLDIVRDNARTLSGRSPRYVGFWLYAGWVIPVANLWIPRGIVADAHQDSAPGERLPRSLNVWWGLWLIGLISGVGLMYADDADDIIARAYDNPWMLLASDAAVIGAAVAGTFVVRAVTAVQQRHIDGDVPYGESPGPAAA
ncbi:MULTISPECIES: DUF4328 domain-containing protein [Streptomyces]|uniref:DUF4328 domain-containing protein n=3 Tax=Streptomyces TaxID=1883 RepID=UPI000D351FFC|nr:MULTISPECIES: DUF4328 domain-containing protein [Streptomyces]MBY8343001.1 DUF4328 domain-containing protein [Streptomyces plumbidurans]PTM95719.1 uncharacterized protein DUF4328 [Streptomyces sp. VMFN-G11Ma]